MRIKCEKLGGFIAEYNFRFFHKENDDISLGTRVITAQAKVYENVFQGLWVMNNWCKCLKGINFHRNRILVSTFRKKSLNWNNPQWHYSPKQLIYCRTLVNIWNSRNKFWEIWKFTLKKATALGSLFGLITFTFLWNSFHWKQILLIPVC